MIDEYRSIGRNLYQRGEFKLAENNYSQAIESNLSSNACELAILYFNRALCRSKQDNWLDSKDDVSTAIKLNYTYMKAWLLKSKIEFQLKQFEGSLISAIYACSNDLKNEEKEVSIQLRKILNYQMEQIIKKEKLIASQPVTLKHLSKLQEELLNLKSRSANLSRIQEIKIELFTIWSSVDSKFDFHSFLSEKPSSKLFIFTVLYLTLTLLFALMNQFDLATACGFISFYVQQHDIFSSNIPDLKVQTIRILSDSLSRMGSIKAAIVWMKREVDREEENHIESEEHVNNLRQLGEIYSSASRFEEALNSFNKAQNIAERYLST